MLRGEKAAVQGSQGVKEQIEKLKLEMDEARRRGDFARMSEIQYGKLPELEAKLKGSRVRQGRGQDGAKPRLLRPR